MDNSKTTWRQANRPSTRRLIQLYSALLHNAHIKGFIDGEIYQGNAKYACVPGFNCYSCPGAVGACPLGAIQNAMASAGHRAGWYVMGIIRSTYAEFGFTQIETPCIESLDNLNCKAGGENEKLIFKIMNCLVKPFIINL